MNRHEILVGMVEQQKKAYARLIKAERYTKSRKLTEAQESEIYRLLAEEHSTLLEITKKETLSDSDIKYYRFYTEDLAKEIAEVEAQVDKEEKKLVEIVKELDHLSRKHGILPIKVLETKICDPIYNRLKILLMEQNTSVNFTNIKSKKVEKLRKLLDTISNSDEVATPKNMIELITNFRKANTVVDAGFFSHRTKDMLDRMVSDLKWEQAEQNSFRYR
jgi:hypothetical protein